ncbi:DUF6397 family protein [Streptomyces sp. NBC_01304]|uniref:DUF6397 family protein n=1 Tax=Streptomyces sp. NBC_01304 TaxID=2903818 RepID=UPI002E140746|nr:DUF6397 family protein [Streptomyces sp. NBC_01304]
MAASAGTHTPVESYATGRAARELELKRGEFELAVQLGCVRTVAGEESGRRRVTRTELDRLRAADGFPGTLRERVRMVGTAQGAELLGVSTGRFTRLARAGLLVPVKWYLNRYRAVVWLYLADDVGQFADANAALLTGQAPETMRSRLAAGEDLRARNWRARRCGFLLKTAGDSWERAAVAASMLDTIQVAELVPDPYERAELRRLQPDPFGTPSRPDSAAAQATARILYADAPDEIRWLRAVLGLELDAARQERAAPRPMGDRTVRVAASGTAVVTDGVPGTHDEAGGRVAALCPDGGADPAPRPRPADRGGRVAGPASVEGVDRVAGQCSGGGGEDRAVGRRPAAEVGPVTEPRLPAAADSMDRPRPLRAPDGQVAKAARSANTPAPRSLLRRFRRRPRPALDRCVRRAVT